MNGCGLDEGEVASLGGEAGWKEFWKASSLTSNYLGKKLPGDSPEGSQRSKLGKS